MIRDPRWLANPLWLIGVPCLLIKFRLAAVLTLVTASLLALICFDYVGTPIARDSPGTDTTILQMGSGYYLWLFSMLIPTAFAICFFFAKQSESDREPRSADDTRSSENEQ